MSVALHNSIVIVTAYLAIAGLAWGVADTLMAQLQDISLAAPPSSSSSQKVWRVVHLSDVHVVGERYGFRIEGGRSGPSGNERLMQVLARLDAIHAQDPLDLIVITGDVTDAGRSTEWAEFIDAIALHPRLSDLMIILPGNHDLNVVDRANPARLDLPTSPKKRLREIRTLSIMADLQGEKVFVVDEDIGRPTTTLRDAIQPWAKRIAAFADTGSLRLTWELANLWPRSFPMVLPPKTQDGLGVILLDSNAQTHFSFTNALGLVTTEQMRAAEAIFTHYPNANWIVALHHHVIEYPKAAKALSERIGTEIA